MRNALFLGVGLLLLVVQGNLYRILGHIPIAGIMPNLVLPLTLTPVPAVAGAMVISLPLSIERGAATRTPRTSP